MGPRRGEQDDPCLVRWGMWLQAQPLTVRWRPGADNGVADHASRVSAQLWDDFTPLMDDTIDDRRARRYKKVGNVLYYGQKRVPELEGAKRKGWLIKAHLELGHATKTALQDMLRRENIGWEAMEAEIEEVVAVCDDCQRGESAPAPAKANKVGRRADWRVGDEWSVDLIVDLPTTSEGNRHCIVFTEAVSGFVEAYPLPDREALTTMGCAQDLFWRFGYPRRIRSDRGNEFLGEFGELVRKAGITWKATSGYHPQGDGQAERTNREVMDKLLRSGADDEWDRHLGPLLWSIRVRPSRRVGGRSPMEVLFGEAPRIPAFVLDVENPSAEEDLLFLEEALKARLAQRQVLKLDVSDALRRYESSSIKWKAQDLVLVRNRQRKKGDPRWIGPAVVIEARDTGLSLKLEDGKLRVVNAGDVKPYRRAADRGSDVEDHAFAPARLPDQGEAKPIEE